jgi:hypothetical protein
VDVFVESRALVALDTLQEKERDAVDDALHSLSERRGEDSVYLLQCIARGSRGDVYVVQVSPRLSLILRSPADSPSRLDLIEVVRPETLASYRAA